MKYVGLYDNAKDIVTKDKLEAVASRVSTNEDNIAMAESDIEGLQTTVGTLQTNVNNVQTALTRKQDTVVGGASTITENNLTASRALMSNSSGKVVASDVTSTELGYLDGVTSSIQTQLNKKLEKVYDNNVLFGGGNIAGDVSPIDAATELNIGGNKAAFSNPDGITIEYTNDGGITWLDYGATDSQKVGLVTYNIFNFYIGKKTNSTSVTTNDMLRISVNSTACGFYTSLKKILIYGSNKGAISFSVKIEKSTIGNPDVFSNIGEYQIAGWSGWNSIPCMQIFGGSPIQLQQTLILRFTFYLKDDSKLTNAYINYMSFIGVTNWQSNSQLAKTNHLYSFDSKQNAVFPANVTATKFIGDGSLLTNVNYNTLNNKPTIPVVNNAELHIQKNGTDIGTFTANSSTNQTINVEVPTKTSELTNDSGYITFAPVTSVNNKTGAVTLSKSDVGLSNVDNIKQYSALNQPPYPVYGVNGDIGDVYTQPYKVNGNLTGATITGTIEAPEEERNKIVLITGTTVILTPDADCPPRCTFNFNDLGARMIVRSKSDSNGVVEFGHSVGWLKANTPVLLIYYRISDTNGQWIVQNMSRPVATDLVGTGKKGQVIGFTAKDRIGVMDVPQSGTKIVVNSATPTGLSSGDWWYQID